MQIPVSTGVIANARAATLPLPYNANDARVVATAVDENGYRSAVPPQGFLKLGRPSRERCDVGPCTMPGNIVDGYCYSKCRGRLSRAALQMRSLRAPLCRA